MTMAGCSGVCVNGCETSLGRVVTRVVADPAGDPVVTRCQVDAKGHKLTMRDCAVEGGEPTAAASGSGAP